MLPRLPTAALFLTLACAVRAEEAPTTAPSPPETAPAAAPSARPSLPGRSGEQAMALARQYPAQSHWLTAGRSDRFLALWTPANRAEARGVVVLLPDEGQHADWPQAIDPLREVLPDHGWHTLSLMLPDPPPPPLPRSTVIETAVEMAVMERAGEGTPTPPPSETEAAAPAPAEEVAQPEPAPETPAAPEEPGETTPPPAPVPDEPPPSHAERIAQRIEAALDFAAGQRAGPVVLAGQGTGAYWAVRFKADNTVAQVARLLLLSPRQPFTEEESLLTLLERTTLPVGDFYYRTPAARETAKQRRDLSRRSGHSAYVQVGLTSLPADPATERTQLVRRVRGWLERPPAPAGVAH